ARPDRHNGIHCSRNLTTVADDERQCDGLMTGTLDRDESLTYPAKHNDSYYSTKDKVARSLSSHSCKGWKSMFIIGDGNNIMSSSIRRSNLEKATRNTFFFTNIESIKFWEFVSTVLEGLGYDKPSIKIPAFVIIPIEHLVKLTYKLLAPNRMKEGLRRIIASYPYLMAKHGSGKDDL
ncbi:hypothetical protein HAX54_018180, partial [Datura stramonium]|nr:hypothetical protein [Datura stramonium]